MLIGNAKRDIAIDAMKCLAIFAVVLGHVIERTDGGGNSLRVFIYSFHMPLFFMASGFIGGGEKHHQFKSIIKKVKLLIPFFVLGIFYTLYSQKNIINDFFFHPMKNGYWFLLTLFILFILYYFASVLSSKVKSDILECIILFSPYILTIWLKTYGSTEIGMLLGVGLLPNYIYFVTGVFLRRYITLQKIILKEIVQILLLAIYILLFVNSITILNPIMKLSITLFIFSFFKNTTNTLMPLSRYLTFIGSRTLDIYVLHYFLIIGLSASGLDTIGAIIYSSPSIYIPITIVFSIFVCIVVLGISYIIRQNKYLKKLLLGVS